MKNFKSFVAESKDEKTTTIGAIKKSKKYIDLDTRLPDSTKVFLSVVQRSVPRAGEDKWRMVGKDDKGKVIVQFGSHPTSAGAEKFLSQFSGK